MPIEQMRNPRRHTLRPQTFMSVSSPNLRFRSFACWLIVCSGRKKNIQTRMRNGSPKTSIIMPKTKCYHFTTSRLYIPFPSTSKKIDSYSYRRWLGSRRRNEGDKVYSRSSRRQTILPTFDGMFRRYRCTFFLDRESS